MTSATGSGILTPPAVFRVTVGGDEYEVCECRPCDIPPLMEFLEAADASKLKERLGGKDGGAFDLGSFLTFVRDRPPDVCRLLAAILDPAPLGPGSGKWREAASARFMALPVSQLTAALGKWLEINGSFFARMAAPLIFGAAEFLRQIQTIVEDNLALMKLSASGSA